MESALRQRVGVRLIETMGDARHDAHLARLARSAARLGYPCDLDIARGLLAQGQGRMRLTLDQFGTFELQTAPMPIAKPVWRVGLAAQRLQSDDPWLTVKSTHRPAYDSARAGLADGLDEVILINERGEVCDGSITTVFFDRGDGMRTPPLSCGVLPGILRADLACTEEILMPADLPFVRLWVGNSLRGLIPALWQG